MEISLTTKDVRSLIRRNLLKMAISQSFLTIMVEDLILLMLLAQWIRIEMEISLHWLILKDSSLTMLEEELTAEDISLMNSEMW